MNAPTVVTATAVQFLCECPNRQSNHDVGKVTPVRATSCGYVGYYSLSKWNHVLADVISQYRLTPVPPNLYKNNIKTCTCIYEQEISHTVSSQTEGSPITENVTQVLGH